MLDVSLSIVAMCLTIAKEREALVRLINIKMIDSKVAEMKDQNFRNQLVPKLEFLKQFVN